MVDFAPGTVLFAGPDDDESVEQAKQYCIDNMYSKEQVRIVRMKIELENDFSAKIVAVIVK